MAPTIQTGHINDRDKGRQRPEKKSELVCRVKYCNTLPDIPFDPKFITYPFDSSRFVQYNPTSLERNYKHDLLTEHDLGVPIDLIDTETYAVLANASLDIADEKLLEEEVSAQQDSKRSRHHAKSVSWLRRTEYISTEFTRFQPSADKTETKVGYNVKRFFKEQDLYMDRESQIKEIDKTFEDSKKAIERHHTKPGVHPVEILEVFPDFEIWKYPCAQVIFDSDPAPIGRPLPAQLEEMSQAMIRGVMDESGEQFVAYFLPTDETMEKRKRDAENEIEYEDEEEYDYKMAREYNWNVKNKASKGYEENYFFVFRNNGVYYNELETRVRLSKRRLKPGTQPNNSRLVVRHRPLNEAEFKTQEIRMTQLEQPQEEEEEEEEEDKPSPAKRLRKSDSEGESDEEKGSDKGEEEQDKESGSEKGQASDREEEDEENVSAPRRSIKKELESDEDSTQEEEGTAKEDEEHSEGEQEDSDGEKQEEKSTANAKSSGSSSSSSSSSGSSSSSSAEEESDKSSSESESEAEDDRKKRDEEEIFGSASDSD